MLKSNTGKSNTLSLKIRNFELSVYWNLSEQQNKNIKEDRLRQYLRLKGYADKIIDGAITQLQQEAGNLSWTI